MKNNLASRILKTFGWSIENEIEYPQKCVICIAPHTSNWDFVYGMLYKSAINLKSNFFIKKEWFRFPFSIMMNKLGGIPVDRSKRTSLTDQMAEAFLSRENFRVAISPEGTREPNARWRNGFYYIACRANVPIALTYLDYKKKTIGLGKIYFPTGNIEIDIPRIKNFYRNISAKFPENFKI